MKNCAAIILAAGKGTRLSKTANKIFLDLAGKSLLQRSLENIARFKRLSSIILVISQKDKQKIKTLLNSFAVKIPVFLVWLRIKKNSTDNNANLQIQKKSSETSLFFFCQKVSVGIK